jgi:octaprenyl-diphosphate synthase
MDKVEKELLASISSEIETLEDICRYIMSSGGKRLRPLILLLTVRFCEYKGDNHIPLACALEYIHTATLLHDDVIDHAELRRGNSSANMLWGNQATILAGDFFLSKAFSLAVEVNNIKILKVLARVSKSMAEAEVFQVSKSNDPLTTEDEYFFIVKNKTAGLIAASSRIGGILGGVTSREERALENYGYNLGIAFQIMDDVLDYYSSERDFGKTIGKDLQEGNITLPFIAALSKSTPEDRKSMIQIIQSKNQRKRELSLVIDLIEKFKGKTYAVEQAKRYIRQATDALKVFRNNGKKKPLVELAEYVVQRKS